MLENKYGEYEALENQRILMERMNVETQEEIDAIIKKDMEDFVAYTDAKMDESIDNYYEFYTSFESWFDDFFASYTKNLQKLGKLNREFLDMLDIEDYLSGNGMNVEGGIGTLGTLSAEDRAALYRKVYLSDNKDYSRDMDEAIRDGDFEAAQEAALLREVKAEIKGITLGQGNYRTNQQVWDDAMKKYYGDSADEITNEIIGTSKNVDKNAQYTLQNGNFINQTNTLLQTQTQAQTQAAQNQTTQLSGKLTNVQQEIIEQNGYTVDAIQELSTTLSLSMDTIVSAIEAGVSGFVDGTNMSNEELAESLAGGNIVSLGGGTYLDPNKKHEPYGSVDEDPGVIGSSAWLEMAKEDGMTDEEIEKIIADITAQSIKKEAQKEVSSMKRNTALAGKEVTIGSSTVYYNEDGYAYKKVANNASVSSDGQIVYTSRDGSQKAVTKLVDTDMISSNIQAVAKIMRDGNDGVSYSIDSIGGVIASQIAASSKEAITEDQAIALKEAITNAGILNTTASLLTSSNMTAEVLSGIGTSVQSAIEYLGKIDSNTAASINDSYSSKSSGGGKSGGGNGGGGSKKANTSGSDRNMDSVNEKGYDPDTDYSLAIINAKTEEEKEKLKEERDNKIDDLYDGEDPNPEFRNKHYSDGIKKGPVTYTGLAMLHGTPQEPEYVLNNDQAYNLLYNLSAARSTKMAEFERVKSSNSGTQYVVQGDIILEGVDDPAKFWQEVTNAMGNRWNVTKNR